MATTIPAVMALIQTSTRMNNCNAWNAVAPVPMTATQRTAVDTAINAGTVSVEADALALIATAAVAPITQKQVWDMMLCMTASVG